MTTTTLTLTAFILARLDEDEAAARDAAAAPRPRGGWGGDHRPTGERWETRHERGMLYVPSIENTADAALWDDEGGCDYMSPAPTVGTHIARHDPARVLAQCAALRAIVAVVDLTPCPCQRSERCVTHDSSAGPPELARERYADRVAEHTLRHVAAIWADHEAYRQEWAA